MDAAPSTSKIYQTYASSNTMIQNQISDSQKESQKRKAAIMNVDDELIAHLDVILEDSTLRNLTETNLNNYSYVPNFEHSNPATFENADSYMRLVSQSLQHEPNSCHANIGNIQTFNNYYNPGQSGDGIGFEDESEDIYQEDEIEDGSASSASSSFSPTPAKKRRVSSRKSENSDNYQDDPQYLKLYDFILQPTKNGYHKLVTFDEKDRNLCYNYYYQKAKSNQYYRCDNCHRRKHTLCAWIRKDANGKEYVRTKNDHICNSVKYIPPGGGVHNQETITIKSPNFKLIKADDDAKIQKLVIFDKNNPSLCYRYNYSTSKKLFYCVKCRGKFSKLITAKVFIDDETKEEIIKYRDSHFCEPEEYEPKEPENLKIIPSNLFELKNGSKIHQENQSLFIYTSKFKLFYYKFFRRTKNNYICLDCNYLKKSTTSKLSEDSETGEKIIKISDEHICEPRFCEKIDEEIV